MLNEPKSYKVKFICNYIRIYMAIIKLRLYYYLLYKNMYEFFISRVLYLFNDYI
jgi:hypothetical protein